MTSTFHLGFWVLRSFLCLLPRLGLLEDGEHEELTCPATSHGAWRTRETTEHDKRRQHGVVARIEIRLHRGRYDRISHTDSVGLRLTKLSHPIEDVARHHCLDSLRIFAASTHPMTC